MESPSSAPELGHRIVIVGSTGAGKTTLAKTLAVQLGYPHFELDALHWDENWTPASLDVFRERVQTVLASETWVADGNYSKAHDLVWSRADSLIWLDYSLLVVFQRLIPRTFRRILTREILWNGNRESWREGVFSRKSLFVWAVQSHKRRRTTFPLLFTQPQYRHLKVLHFHTPRATERWLDDLCGTYTE